MYPQESTNVESIEAVDEDEDDTEDIALENERCGICTDIIIDRGVLDCCDDWFCFACIDNWATITNCCPICKNVFQLITCLPVYDTTGSIRVENYLLSRDDDWSVQGKNNTLSFPSYYIDEDAVACLDGDGCKVRSGLTTVDDELSFDTSIACDSCDIWYHAFCVEFQPESTAVSSWLCPRCLSVEESENMCHVSLEDQERNSDLKGVELGWEVDHSFLGKVSVSVADDGETALVVSMVQADQMNEDKISASMENWEETNVKKEIESSSSDSMVTHPKPNDPAEKIGSLELKDVSQGGPISLSHSVIHSSMEANCVDETVCSPRFNEHDDSFSLSCSSYQNVAELPQDKFGELVDVAAKDPLVINRSLHSSEECNISVDGIITSSVEDVVNAICQEDFKAADSVRADTVTNLHIVDVDSMSNHNEKRKQESQAKSKAEGNAKKPRLDRMPLMMPSGSQATVCISDCESHPKTVTDCKGGKMKYAVEDEAQPTDIMSIVREDHKLHDSQTGRKLVNKFMEIKENPAGLRVKKIMRRIGDKADKEIIVQKLGKEIKEAVQDDTSDWNTEDNAFHGKLLTAFREAIIKPTVVGNKPNPSLGMRKQLLKKGKIRENLTKKIYGTSNGRRRRAWDRDWEIEFWKYRCPKVKPEKVETLQSVLELLKKATTPTENLEMDQGPEGEITNSILSRVYLADASVFPRKDDIKPLSAVTVDSNEKKERNLVTNISEGDSQRVVNNVSNGPKLPTNVQPSDNQGINISVPIIPQKATCKSRNTSVQNSGNSAASAASIAKGKGRNLKETFVSDKKERILKEPGNLSAMAKTDKKKWAMEVLARKNASTSSSAVKDLQQDGAVLGGKYPLLAQLPIDMKPVVAPSRQNKISISVRQAQLYRIAEHYLKRTNLSVIHRTADVELAVADAVNVEKEISERSNSKMVYVNLCAQVIAECTKPQSEADPSDLLVNCNSSDDQAIESSGNCISQVAEETILESTPLEFTDVEEALRVAGLSDSPPNSPEKTTNGSNADVDPLINIGEQNVGNVRDIDNFFQCNTRADSENKSMDGTYFAATIAANSSKVSELQNGNAKMMVHSSTECKELCKPVKEPLIHTVSTAAITKACKATDKEGSDINDENGTDELAVSNHESKNCSENNTLGDEVPVKVKSSRGENSPNSFVGEIASKSEQGKPSTSESSNSVYKKVEAYVKEHIRPLCKSGVITVEQYRWAVGRTTDKVVARHGESKNANFLIKEGDKVKRLAEQYAEVAQQKMR